MSTPVFTQDWFSLAIPAWEKHIVPALKDKECMMLEIGSFEGRSALWSLEHFLTHPQSKIICCDIFGEFFHYKDDELLNVFLKNTAAYRDKIIVCRGKSQETLKKKTFWKYLHDKIDFGYIDGGHTSPQALQDAVLLWPLIKPGGFLCFDDYYGGIPESTGSCHIGINAFLLAYRGEYDILHQEYQVIIRKKLGNT